MYGHYEIDTSGLTLGLIAVMLVLGLMLLWLTVVIKSSIWGIVMCIKEDLERQKKEIEISCRIYDEMEQITEPILLYGLERRARELNKDVKQG